MASGPFPGPTGPGLRADSGVSRISGSGRGREYGVMPENRRLVRVRDGRILAGVCTGLGRYTRVDPVIFRVGLAVLTIGSGGSGIFLYVAAVLLTPADDDAVSVAEQLFRRRFDGDTVLAMLGALLTAGVAFSVLGHGLGAGSATGPLPPPPSAPAGDPAPRGGSGLTPFTLLAALGAGVLTVPLTSHHPDTTRVSIAIAAGLAVIGAGLIIASWYGRARGLVFLGVVLCLALATTSAIGELPRDGRWGDVTWRPLTVQADHSYRVIIGEGDLDLTSLPLGAGQRVRVHAEVSFGEMKVTVPSDVTTEVHARSSLGDLNVAGKVTPGPGAKVDVVLPAEGKVGKRPPVIELFVRGRIGDVEVLRGTT